MTTIAGQTSLCFLCDFMFIVVDYIRKDKAFDKSVPWQEEPGPASRPSLAVTRLVVVLATRLAR